MKNLRKKVNEIEDKEVMELIFCDSPQVYTSNAEEIPVDTQLQKFEKRYGEDWRKKYQEEHYFDVMGDI